MLAAIRDTVLSSQSWFLCLFNGSNENVLPSCLGMKYRQIPECLAQQVTAPCWAKLFFLQPSFPGSQCSVNQEEFDPTPHFSVMVLYFPSCPPSPSLPHLCCETLMHIPSTNQVDMLSEVERVAKFESLLIGKVSCHGRFFLFYFVWRYVTNLRNLRK